MITLEVLQPGPLTTVQDLGRPGLAHLGVTGSGAADRRSHTLANRLVGNPETWATLEITLGGFCARLRGGDIEIALTGADAGLRADGVPLGHNAVGRIREGQLITLATPASGLRSYLALRGGIDTAPVLGSRSRDTLAGLGPSPVSAGDVIGVGAPARRLPAVDLAPVAATPAGPVTLRVIPGPRRDWFADPDTLAAGHWLVSPHSDRIGVRLTGPPLTPAQPGRQLPSEGTVRGAIQVPPGGLPVILGPDHPVTGGYPVIGVVVSADIDAVAQLRPGQTVRLVELTR